MADESYAPKPTPPDRMVSWPVLIAWRVRDLLTWPWQVRQMKAAGFRRVGWMTWETGPPEPPVGQLFMGPLGTTEPMDADLPKRWPGDGLDAVRYSVQTATDVKLRSCQGISPEMAGELAEGIQRLAPSADPDHDVLANSPLCPVELEPVIDSSRLEEHGGVSSRDDPGQPVT